MDLDFSGVPTTIASGTTQFIQNFSNVFLLIGGIVLALAVLTALQNMFMDWGEKEREKHE